jgi:hypothetical protein
VDESKVLRKIFGPKKNAVNLKGKIVPVLFFNRAPLHESILGSGGIAPRIL